MATAALLGLAPFYRAGLVDDSIPLVLEAKVGSSAAGAAPGASSHHPDRSGAVRSFEPTGHRHTAELIQELLQYPQNGSKQNQSRAADISPPYPESQDVSIGQTVAFSATAIEL